jgi:hypothetical protein
MNEILPKPLAFFKEDPSPLRKFFDMGELRLLQASLVKKQFVPVIARQEPACT